MPNVDIDALLDKEALTLKIAGQEIVLRDLPVSAVMQAAKIEGEGADRIREYFHLVLPQIADEQLEQIGIKAATVIMREVNRFLSAMAAEAEAETRPSPTGPEPSPASSTITGATN